MQILAEEKQNIIRFINSQDFSALCEIIGQDDDVMRDKTLGILKSKTRAKQAAKIFSIRFGIVSLLLFLSCQIFAILPANSQPFPPIPSSGINLKDTIPEPVNVTELVLEQPNKVQIKVKGKLKTYIVRTYVYLDDKGEKVAFPFLIEELSHAKHPVAAKVKLAGKKVMLLAPFLNVAGSIAQIFTAIKL